jgi:hypothetical protein
VPPQPASVPVSSVPSQLFGGLLNFVLFLGTLIGFQQGAAQSAFPQPIPPHPSTPTPPRLFVCITLLFPFEQNACGSLPGSKSSTGLSHF